jgi:hypothetical protein
MAAQMGRACSNPSWAGWRLPELRRLEMTQNAP